MFDKIKKQLGENLALYPPQGMARVDWSRRCAIRQFWFHIFFLEVQVTEEWSVQLDSYSWRLSQKVPVLWIEQNLTLAFQTQYFRVFVLYNSDAGDRGKLVLEKMDEWNRRTQMSTYETKQGFKITLNRELSTKLIQKNRLLLSAHGSQFSDKQKSHIAPKQRHPLSTKVLSKWPFVMWLQLMTLSA
jgi:hypothetical protein